jgi:hypothetical protein
MNSTELNVVANAAHGGLRPAAFLPSTERVVNDPKNKEQAKLSGRNKPRLDQ